MGHHHVPPNKKIEKSHPIPIPMAFPSPDDKELCAMNCGSPMSRTGDDYIYDVIVYIYITIHVYTVYYICLILIDN